MSSAKILIIDDDDLLCDMVASILELEGYETAFAHNGKQGLAALEEGEYSLILLDLVMPEMDGLQFLRTVGTKHPSHPPIVVMSASVTADIFEEGKNIGVAGMIKKPVKPGLLTETVRAALAKG